MLHTLERGSDVVGVFPSEAAQQCAANALFQLQERDMTKSNEHTGNTGGTMVQTKHVMISYCWEQQQVIKRVHTALVARGYRMWIDIEQMKGSTVDSMAAAVEDAEVMLMGVSQQYKESTNCEIPAATTILS
eukprot:SAG31_NODE_10586_length_1121_cov_1.096869_1_plen_132_part_10